MTYAATNGRCVHCGRDGESLDHALASAPAMTDDVSDAIALDMSVVWLCLEGRHPGLDLVRIRRGWEAMRAALIASVGGDPNEVIRAAFDRSLKRALPPSCPESPANGPAGQP